MGSQLAKEQEQLKNLNCNAILNSYLPYSQREGTPEALQEFQQN